MMDEDRCCPALRFSSWQILTGNTRKRHLEHDEHQFPKHLLTPSRSYAHQWKRRSIQNREMNRHHIIDPEN